MFTLPEGVAQGISFRFCVTPCETAKLSATVGGMTPEWTRGERLRKARVTAGITVEAMARCLDCTERTVRNYEFGATRARTPTLALWATLTDVPMWWLDNAERPELLVTNDKPTEGMVTRGNPTGRRAA